MKDKKSTFALCFGNRAFSPESYVAVARKEVSEILTKLGYGILMMDSKLTHFGSVDNREDGRKYAKFLDDHRGRHRIGRQLARIYPDGAADGGEPEPATGSAPARRLVAVGTFQRGQPVLPAIRHVINRVGPAVRAGVQR